MKIKYVLLSGFLVFAAASATATEVQAIKLEGYHLLRLEVVEAAFENKLNIDGEVEITKVIEQGTGSTMNGYLFDLRISSPDERISQSHLLTMLYPFERCVVWGWHLDPLTETKTVLVVEDCVSLNGTSIIEEFRLTQDDLGLQPRQRRRVFKKAN